jgi:4-amino-4-deoxy-L-arabinose transferase-like glycosyltransferase
LLAALYLAPLLIDVPLLDPDEGLHAAIAREMVERGDWVVPRFLGEPFLDKPILFFWAQALSLSLLGCTEAAVRLPGLLFAVAGALTTGLLARSLLAPSLVWPATAIMATLALPFGVAQAAVHDVALVPWTNLALLGFWLQQRNERRNWTRVVLVGVALGLAVLTKGLSGVALVGVAYGAFLIWSRRLSRLAIVEGALALAVAGLVAAPWYLLVEQRQPGYLEYYFVERHLLGYATGTQTHGDAPWWYYLPILVLGSLPWCGWLIDARRLEAEASPGARRRREGRCFLWAWMIADLLFLSGGSSKLLTYALPIFPAVALLATAGLDAWSRAGNPGASRGLLVSLAAPPALIIAAIVAAQLMLGNAGGWPTLLGALIVATAAGLGVRFRAPHPHAALGAAWVSLLACYAAALVLLFPIAGERYSARILAEHLNARPSLPERVLIFDERIGSVAFYLDPARRRALGPEGLDHVDLGALRLLSQAVTETDLVVVPVDELDRLDTLNTTAPSGVRVGRFVVYPAQDLLQFRGT